MLPSRRGRPREHRQRSSRSLEKRQIGWLGAGAIGIAAFLYPLFYEKDEQRIPEPLKIPPAQLEESFELETATAIVVVTESTPQITVTAPPDQDKATG